LRNESIKTLKRTDGAARSTKIIRGYPMNNNRENFKETE